MKGTLKNIFFFCLWKQTAGIFKKKPMLNQEHQSLYNPQKLDFEGHVKEYFFQHQQKKNQQGYSNHRIFNMARDKIWFFHKHFI